MENSEQFDPKQKHNVQHLEKEHGLWTIDFDGAPGKDGAGIGILIRSPHHQQGKLPQNVILFSYKLSFDCTNNEAEYEALIIGLKILKMLGA